MKSKDGKKFSIQTISITLAGLIGSALNGIIAYVAVYFFKPLWEKIVKYFHKQ
jgi:uncharacterized membrane protein